MPRHFSLFCCAAAFAALAATSLPAHGADAAKIPPPPPTKKVPVTDTYYGIKVTDDYRWLENGNSPAVKAWVAAQNAYTHNYLEQQPQRPALVQAILAMRHDAHPGYAELETANGRLFALRRWKMCRSMWR